MIEQRSNSILMSSVRQVLGDLCLDIFYQLDEITVIVPAEHIVDVLRDFKRNPQLLFKQLMDICGVDYPGRAQRFDVVYHLLSHKLNHRIRVKVKIDEDLPIPSVCKIHSAANWYEREIWDLYGIHFNDHPDLRRILTDYNFEGHPLRKDFPLTGYVEMRYDNEQQKVTYSPVQLPQAFRDFDTLSPWEGDVSAHVSNRHAVLLPGDEKATKDGVS